MIDPTWPSPDFIAITPSNSTEFSQDVRMLYVGTGGTVSVTSVQGTTVTFTNVPNGATLGPFFIRKVNATGTTASAIIGFY